MHAFMLVVGYFWTLLECMHDRCMHTDRHVWIVTMKRSTCNYYKVYTYHLSEPQPHILCGAEGTTVDKVG